MIESTPRRPRRKLRKWRTGRKLSLTQVAKTIGCTRQAVSHWELGRGVPREQFVYKLATLYGVPQAELLAAIYLHT